MEMIKKLGGVPFCKTNVPQSMMSIQCSNPIYGTSSNPHSQPGNPRECGGSSGGEGALLGGRGSILGLGSDIGGSLRSPVAFCGAVSLKPTAGRHLSQLGVTGPSPAPPVGVPVTGGFMTTSVRALGNITLFSQEPVTQCFLYRGQLEDCLEPGAGEERPETRHRHHSSSVERGSL